MMNPFYIAQRIFRGRKAPLALLISFLVFFIWWIGPKLPYPFNSVVVRSLIITGILAVTGGVMAWRRKKTKKKTDDLMEAVAEPDESEILKKRFKSAVKTLRTSEKAGRKGLLELPWYIIIGPPGSGKTTLLRNAGLNFPLGEEDGSLAVKGVGGTRDCDWWFADEAVLLDTAGRYTTQDSNEETDRKAWSAFLDLLKGRSKKRPVNGIFVAIGADILLASSTDEIQNHATLIRNRVLELYSRLKGRFPVYLLITKIDLVAGFTEFFENLTAEERDQVWGYTQQIIKDEGEVANIEAIFDGEFELLLSRLSGQALDRLRDEPDAKRRALILGFPEQLARARHQMRQLLTQGFSPNAYQESILLRGLYMTSGTQEGAPIDRMMGGLAKALKVEQVDIRQTQSSGRSYFIKDFLSRVAFPEQDLLGIGFKQAEKRRKIQLGSYVGIAGAAALALIVWTYAYFQERDYVLEAEQTLLDYRENVTPLPDPNFEFDQQTREVVLRLDQLKSARDKISDSNPDSPLIGLPGDDALIEAVDDAYYSQLDQALAPLVVSSLTNRLQRRDGMVQEVTAFNNFEVNLLSTFIRAYGSLENSRKRLNSKEAREDFANAILYDLELRDPTFRVELQEHLLAWVNQPRGPQSKAINQTVLEGARSSLLAGGDGLGPVRSAYDDWLFRQLYRVGEGDGVTPGLVDQIGLNANDVFQRRSGGELNAAIPYIFTREGFTKFYAVSQAEILASVERDKWVYGTAEGGSRIFKGSAAKKEISKRYVNDYIQFWRDLMNDVTIRKSNRGDVLRGLSRNPSPLKEYLRIVASNTALEKKKEARRGIKVPGLNIRNPQRPNAGTVTPKQRVTEAFVDVTELLGSEDSAGKIDEVVAEIRILSNEIAAIEAGDPLVGNTTQARRNLESLARDLESSGTGLELVVREVLGTADQGRTKGTVAQIQQKYKQVVLPACRRKISRRYPFTSSASKDVGLRDLEDIFGPDGVMTRFIEEDLEPLIDKSRGGWTWKNDVRSLVTDGNNLTGFERAGRIKDAFFGRNSIGSSFDITPIKLGDGSERSLLTIDGQSLDYYGQTARVIRNIKWPSGDVRLTLNGKTGDDLKFTPDGDWSLFKLLDRASSLQPLNGGTSLIATFRQGENSISYRIDTDSVDNPFTSYSRWRNFRCPASLW